MKYFFAILFTFSSLFSYSQLPDGSIAPNFITTDVNGNEHELYNYLDMGYTVILQISASWSGPDWNYSSNGVLQEVWENHGPAGQPGVSPNTTDDVMILWFEGDAGTAESELENSDFGNWLIYIGNKKVNSKWNVHNEVQYRNYDAIGDLEQLLLRTGVGYNLSENNHNLLLGYGYILSQNYSAVTEDKLDVNEHRIFQQFTSKQKIGNVSLSHRYRFEQRFVESDFKMRLRYFLAFKVPILKTETSPTKLYLSAYNEVFLNTESDMFDRNRVYGGLGYQLNNNVRIEAGYMNQLFEHSSRDQFNLITFVNF